MVTHLFREGEPYRRGRVCFSSKTFDRAKAARSGDFQMYSDYQLGIVGRWFTGEEWVNGTAQRESIREFVEAEAKLKVSGIKPVSQKASLFDE